MLYGLLRFILSLIQVKGLSWFQNGLVGLKWKDKMDLAL